MSQSRNTAHIAVRTLAELRMPSQLAASQVALAELRAWLTRIRFDGLEAARHQVTVHPRRSYVRLPTAGACEAWLICWPSGSSAPLHDHGEADGVAAVLTGQLHEWRYLHDERRWTESTWTRGSIIELTPRTCHEVANLSQQPAYSIHVYTPCLDSMMFYERTADGGVRQLRREAANQW